MRSSILRRYRNTVWILSILLLLAICFSVFLGISYSRQQTEIQQLQNRLTEMQIDLCELQDALNLSENDRALQQEKFESVQSSYEQLQKSYDSLLSSGVENYKELESEYQNLQTEYDILLHRYQEYKNTVKVAYLTFDDGVSVNTNKILNILDEYEIHATFFANWQSWGQKWYSEIVNRGHTLGNHCASHDWEDIYSSPEAFLQQVTLYQENVKKATGGYIPQIFRFPGGSNNTIHKNYNPNVMPAAIQSIRELGLTYFDWNVDSGDAERNHVPAETLISNVLTSAKNKKSIIVLMHDTGAKDTTVEALPFIIEGLRDQGYIFSVLTQYTEPIQFRKQ